MEADRQHEQAAAQGLHRYEISALIGPCTMDEAVAMLDRLSDEKALGAAWAVQQLEEGYFHVDAD